MSLRPLVISPEVKHAAQELVNFASRRENWFDPRIHKFIPGDRPEYTISFNTFRCCFTYTVGKDGSVFRMASVSVPGDKYPNPVAVWVIADMLGFTGGKKMHDTVIDKADDWIVYAEEAVQAIVVAQKLEGLKA